MPILEEQEDVSEEAPEAEEELEDLVETESDEDF